MDTLDRGYGSRLTVSFIGRTGLIFLKFHAALDSTRKRQGVDEDDLILLNPNREETTRVLAWLEKQELLTAGNRKRLQELLKTLNHDDLFS